MTSQSPQQSPQQSPPRYAHGTNDQHYQIYHDNKLKCVCQLCSCGKHKCPRPRVKGNFSTSYTDHYKNMKITPTGNHAPEYRYQPRHYNADTLKTSYQDTYVPQALPPSPSKFGDLGSKIVYQAPFIGQTSYKDQYKPYQIKPVQNPEQSRGAPGQYVRPTVKFDGNTSYKAHYVEPPKVQSRPIPQPAYHKANIPFNGSSSYKNDFPQYKIQPKQALHQPTVRGPQVKFDATTSYKDQYKGYQMRSPEGDIGASRHVCVVEKMNVPTVNYINDENHIYYNPDQRKFV